MADVVSEDIRSKMMSGIRSKDTKPELLIRRGLHRHGLRYRLHVKSLPGKPDIVFNSKKAVIFVHGCFWHGHNCYLFKWPKSRQNFWQEKIKRNMQNDESACEKLKAAGWRILNIWECALKGKNRFSQEDIAHHTNMWVRHGTEDMEIRGNQYVTR